MAIVPLRRHLGAALLLLPPTPRRAARFVLTGWLLSLAGIWAVQRVHADLHEHVELPPVLHLLRDGSLAVPFAALAIALGGLVALQAADVARMPIRSRRAQLTWAFAAAFVFAALSAPGNEVHALLFGADQEEVDWLADILLDSSIVLAAALVVLVPATLLRLAPWPPELHHAGFHAPSSESAPDPTDAAVPAPTDPTSG